MPSQDWNAHYRANETPWDTGEPDAHLVQFVRSGRVRPGRTLELGCGTGNDSIWLALQGFTVLGVDVADLAVERARSKAAETSGCRFATLDIMRADIPGGPYEFVFDRGCFHTFDGADDRSRFASRVADTLAPEGMWLSLIGSTEGPERGHGPPRRSARDIVEAIEPYLEIVELRTTEFVADIPSPARAWFCLSQKRRVPAQSSSRRD